MFCKIKKFIGKLNIYEKVLFFILLLLGIGALIPVYRLALYSCPYYDDYSYSEYVRNFYVQDGFFGIFKGIYHTVVGFWYSWQGTYASAAVMSLAGMSFGEEYYFLSIWAVITIISLGSFSLIYTLARKVLEASGYVSSSLGILASVFLTQFIYSSYQGIFWYNSAAHYTLMHGIMFFMLSCAVNIVYSKKLVSKVLWALLTTMLGFVSAGANFVTCLQGLLFLLLVFVCAIIWKRKNSIYLIIPIVLYSLGLYQNLSAPGNSVRAAFFTGESPVKAILHSFFEAFIQIPKLTSLSSLVVVAAMIPFIINAVNKCKLSFKLPGVVSVLAFCLYATGYTSSFYSWAGPPIDRTYVAIKFTYQILLLVVIAYWIGYFAIRLGVGNKAVKYNIAYFAALVITLVICFIFSKDQAGGYLTYGSYYYVHDCEAQSFRAEYLERIDIIRNSDGGSVGVPAHKYHPWLLIGPNELSTSETAEQNSFMARYYGVDAIYIDEDYSK